MLPCRERSERYRRSDLATQRLVENGPVRLWTASSWTPNTPLTTVSSQRSTVNSQQQLQQRQQRRQQQQRIPSLTLRARSQLRQRHTHADKLHGRWWAVPTLRQQRSHHPGLFLPRSFSRPSPLPLGRCRSFALPPYIGIRTWVVTPLGGKIGGYERRVARGWPARGGWAGGWRAGKKVGKIFLGRGDKEGWRGVECPRRTAARGREIHPDTGADTGAYRPRFRGQ